MTNHPNRAKISQESWLDAEKNRELCIIAGDIAIDALRGYYDARDIRCPNTAIECHRIAMDEAYKGRRGWEYDAADKNDPAGEIAIKVLSTLGFELRSGSIGFDATIKPIQK